MFGPSLRHDSFVTTVVSDKRINGHIQGKGWQRKAFIEETIWPLLYVLRLEIVDYEQIIMETQINDDKSWRI